MSQRHACTSHQHVTGLVHAECWRAAMPVSATDPAPAT